MAMIITVVMIITCALTECATRGAVMYTNYYVSRSKALRESSPGVLTRVAGKPRGRSGYRALRLYGARCMERIHAFLRHFGRVLFGVRLCFRVENNKRTSKRRAHRFRRNSRRIILIL